MPFKLYPVHFIKHAIIRDPGSLAAAGPRSCYRAALAIFKSALRDLNVIASLDTIPKEARPQELIRNDISVTPYILSSFTE